MFDRLENARLRLALASSIAVMAEDAADSDGFTTRQLEIIETYAPLIGITLITFYDKHEEPKYRLIPKPSFVIGHIQREIEGLENQEQPQPKPLPKSTLIVFCMVLTLLTVAMVFAALLTSVFYGG